MLIKYSKRLKYINLFFPNMFIGVSILFFSVYMKNVTLELNLLVNVMIILVLYITMITFHGRWEDIEINEIKGIGSASIKFPRNRRKYVSKESVDINRSQQRSWLDKLFGEYKIYDTKGDGFRIYRRYFNKNDFELIQTQLHDVLGVDIV